MKKRRWNSQKKLEIVMVGLSKTWREQLLSRGNRVFDSEPDKRTQQLESKVKALTGLVGQLELNLLDLTTKK